MGCYDLKILGIGQEAHPSKGPEHQQDIQTPLYFSLQCHGLSDAGTVNRPDAWKA